MRTIEIELGDDLFELRSDEWEIAVHQEEVGEIEFEELVKWVDKGTIMMSEFVDLFAKYHEVSATVAQTMIEEYALDDIAYQLESAADEEPLEVDIERDAS